MDLRLPTKDLYRYKSPSQRARVGTESWGAINFFCPACESPRLDVAARNTGAVDYFCPSCESPFQLKSQSKPLGTRIVDAAYSEMKRAILEDRTPNLFVLHYDLDTWAVRTILLVPHFAFALSALERRKPLAPTARRAGWVGCNILLDKIPVHARISIVDKGTGCREQTQSRHHATRFHQGAGKETLALLQTHRGARTPIRAPCGRVPPRSVLRLRVLTFITLFLRQIRQQVQALRDLGLLTFLGSASYGLR